MFDEVQIEPIILGYSTTRNISWKYENKHKCQIKFTIQYYINSSDVRGKIFEYSTVNNHYVISNLEINQIYSIQVRPQFINKNGSFSKPRTIFTFHRNLLFIFYFVLNLLIKIKPFAMQNANIIYIFVV